MRRRADLHPCPSPRVIGDSTPKVVITLPEADTAKENPPNMPFSGPGTYIETMDEFIGHWTDVNLDQAPGALVMPGSGYTVANLNTDRDATFAKMDDLESIINVLEMHRTDRDNKELPLLDDMKQLTAYVRGQFPHTNLPGTIPSVPSLNASQGVWQKAMSDSGDLWDVVNTTPPAGFTPPLILPNTTTRAQFGTKVASLNTTLESFRQTLPLVDRTLFDRDEIYNRVAAELGKYRAAVLALYGEASPYFLSVPRLYPLPGHTPDPVSLTGFWDVSKDWAEFNWTASADPDIVAYVLRRSGSNPYSGATEQHVETLDAGTLTFTTDEGLLTPGGTMRFKIYVVLNTGNERGSNVVEITRPL